MGDALLTWLLILQKLPPLLLQPLPPLFH